MWALRSSLSQSAAYLRRTLSSACVRHGLEMPSMRAQIMDSLSSHHLSTLSFPRYVGSATLGAIKSKRQKKEGDGISKVRQPSKGQLERQQTLLKIQEGTFDMLPSVVEFLNNHLDDPYAVLSVENIKTISEIQKAKKEMIAPKVAEAMKKFSANKTSSTRGKSDSIDSSRVQEVIQVKSFNSKPESRESLIMQLASQIPNQDLVTSPVKDNFSGSTYIKMRENLANSIPFGAPLTHPIVQAARAAELERLANRLAITPAGGRAAQVQERQYAPSKATSSIFNFFERPGGILPSNFGDADSNDTILALGSAEVGGGSLGSRGGSITHVPEGRIDGLNNFATGSGATNLEFMRHISGRRSNFITSTMKTISTVLLTEQLKAPPPVNKQVCLPLDIGAMKKKLEQELRLMRKQERNNPKKQAKHAQKASDLFTTSGSINLSKFEQLKESLFVDLFQVGFVVDRIIASRDLSHATAIWSAPCLYPPRNPIEDVEYIEPPEVDSGPTSSFQSPRQILDMVHKYESEEFGIDFKDADSNDNESLSPQQRHEKVLEAAQKVQSLIDADPNSPAAQLIKHLIKTSESLSEANNGENADEFVLQSHREAAAAKEATKQHFANLKLKAPVSSATVESPTCPAPNFRFGPSSYSIDPIDTPRPKPRSILKSKFNSSKIQVANSRLSAINVVRRAVEAYLELQIPRIRWALGKALNIRYVPTISFAFDEQKHRRVIDSHTISNTVQEYVRVPEVQKSINKLNERRVLAEYRLKQLNDSGDSTSMEALKLQRLIQSLPKSISQEQSEYFQRRKNEWQLEGQWSPLDELNYKRQEDDIELLDEFTDTEEQTQEGLESFDEMEEDFHDEFSEWQAVTKKE